MILRCAVVALLSLVMSGPVAAQRPAQAIAYDYTALYDALNPSIAKIYTDSGHGSGFLVTEDGLIATNHHVVSNSRYLAAQFADGPTVAAHVVVLDPRHDVAILKVNPAVVFGRRPLHLLPETGEGTVRPGSPAIAFGSPLSQTFLVTEGIVSKVEELALLGDFLLEPGNSGGPLVNLNGEVIGINTFGVRGIAGAVPVGVLREILESSELARYDAPDPPADPLRMVSADRYPIELLKAKALEPAIDDDAYELDAGRFTITAITPVHVARLHLREDLIQARNRMARRGRRMNDPSLSVIDAPFYEWTRVAADWLDYAVTFEIKPDFGSTTGSKWAAFATAFAAGYTQTPMLMPHQNFEFKAEFMDFRVYRDGELLQPIHPGRAVTEASFRDYNMTFIDEAYSGMYVYAPEDFMIGRSFRFAVYDAREADRVHKTINVNGADELIRQIRADFTDPLGSYEASDADASWPVAHDHEGGSFEAGCEGVLTLGDTMLVFRSENAWENWAFFLDGDVREIARNRLIGNHVNAFHVTVPNRTFNFSYINDGQAGADSTELIAIVRAAMNAERP